MLHFETSVLRPFSVKGQIIVILAFVGNYSAVSCKVNMASDNALANGLGHVPITLYLPKQAAGQIWCAGSSLQRPAQTKPVVYAPGKYPSHRYGMLYSSTRWWRGTGIVSHFSSVLNNIEMDIPGIHS